MDGGGVERSGRRNFDVLRLDVSPCPANIAPRDVHPRPLPRWLVHRVTVAADSFVSDELRKKLWQSRGLLRDGESSANDRVLAGCSGFEKLGRTSRQKSRKTPVDRPECNANIPRP